MTAFTNWVGHVTQKPLISVCIVTYNQQNYIRDTVMSVLAQVNPAEFDLEILIGDDFSTDSTPAILQELAMRHPDSITLMTHSQNVGGCENYLTLLRRARGDFIAHLDGDDYWFPGKLSAQLTFLRLHQECVAVYTSAVVVDGRGKLVGGFSNAQPEVIDVDYLLARGNFLNHSSLMYRATARESLLALQVPFVDYMVHLRLARQAYLGLLPAAYVVYRRMTTTSMLRNQFRQFDELYIQTILLMAPAAPKSVRYSCCATYIVNTLGAHPSFFKKKDFWLRTRSLVHGLRLHALMLFGPILHVAFVGMRKILSVYLMRVIYSSNNLTIIHPRD